MKQALRVIAGGRSPGVDPGADATREARRALLQELYRSHAPAVYARCRYLLKSEADAEDAMQEVFARAITKLAHFRGEAAPLTWLTKIATHHCLNILRGRRTRGKKTELHEAAVRDQSHDAPGLLEARDQVHRHLARFDLETQAAAVHYHVDGMTLEEVAELLGRSVPTIRKRLARFARALAPEVS